MVCTKLQYNSSSIGNEAIHSNSRHNEGNKQRPKVGLGTNQLGSRLFSNRLSAAASTWSGGAKGGGRQPTRPRTPYLSTYAPPKLAAAKRGDLDVVFAASRWEKRERENTDDAYEALLFQYLYMFACVCVWFLCWLWTSNGESIGGYYKRMWLNFREWRSRLLLWVYMEILLRFMLGIWRVFRNILIKWPLV